MALTCKCGSGLSNTGYPSCINLLAVAHGIIMVPYYDEDGEVNAVDLSDTLDSAYVVAKINHADADKRWYPVMGIKNVENLRGDPEFETFNDNSMMRVQDGVRTFKGFAPGVSNKLLAAFDSASCETIGIFIVGVNGELQGNDSVAGFLYPILVSKNSFVATLMLAQDKAVQKVNLQFQIDQSERDQDLAMITREEFDNYDLTKIKGLIDATTAPVLGQITQVNLAVDVSMTLFGTAITKDPIEGLVVADFISSDDGATSRLYNETDDTNVTITSVTEVSGVPGRYILNYASQTVSDVLKVLIKKNGFEFTVATATVV